MHGTTSYSGIKRKAFIKLAIVAGIVFIAITVFAFSTIRQGNNIPEPQIMRWNLDGADREAMVYIPETANVNLTPVIFIFHGHGGTMTNMFRTHEFQKLWPEAIIVSPQGLNTPGQLTDPGGTLPGWQKSPGDMNDRDLHFFDAMLKTLRTNYKVDDKRIFATGHSNGGSFTYLLWATRGDELAAVAPSGAAALRISGMLKPKPAMHIMGESDPLVKTEWQKTMCDRILKIDNCQAEGENYDTHAMLYPSSSGNPVVLYIHPGGHVYPQEAEAVVIRFFKSIVK